MQGTVLRRGGLAILIFLAIGVAGLSGQVTNGSFETNGGVGTSIFAGWTVTDQAGGDGSCRSDGDVAAFGFPVQRRPGKLCGDDGPGGPGSHLLYQNIAVPATGGSCPSTSSSTTRMVRFGPESGDLDFNVFPNQARVDIMTTASPVDDVGAGVLQNVYIRIRATPRPADIPRSRLL
jgi:hypothetical protein